MKKEKWMKKGQKVEVLGRIGVITKIIKSGIGNSSFVHYIRVRLDGFNGCVRYHPEDVKPI